ncbi:HERV-H LTR-associating protein 2 isoform X1 [Microtus oregoni]|uniref:HERV-H LTR-associating protein 2 isoform X1 n=1 Tax=Microtus oregoni TaxID=111838 RepID=UPI001BB2BA69|nr:HERV-H LTR-associating protein 2 isoform X1 [Microtus oregoni]XP_041529378.1 HERV-H LTR-associating protein 2 isoform X1 [Microtus oregoni]XP_041529379.1 HERV-H LTR-associating protein 2 isoform X1 [Microtus oregoni]XP_041529380.1 HERV-H LTR-associating protein 2 isoform X1 [Microtus oregoni]XP_041529381.1 HERV-H LTR-associating protein 2 isoform X1 [Microtus oregoni]XP_041529382.1 HERV-H LTR-associating protein 2 isoform X1 [Microtus oregoni]XP_041529383.1 HERV-H LTR-associating protein 2
MKAQALRCIFFAVTLYPCGSFDTFLPVLFSHRNRNNEQLILGRYDEDVILPCLFTSGSQVVIHWISQDNYVHSYYSGKDQLEKQHFRYAHRTSLVHSEINNGNASLTVRRLSLQDEGIYICYVGTTSTHTENTVVLKVGAFHTPLIKYEKRNTESFLVCSIPIVYPCPHIIWKMDNTNVSESDSQVTGAPGPFNISSTLNITGSNSSFECTIENSLLNQTWRGEWTLAGSHQKIERDSISLWCTTSHNFSLLNQDFQVSWSKVVNGASFVLDWHPNSSQDIATNDPQFSGNKELRYNSDFSLILKDLRASDSGEYLCNVSSIEYTLLTVHRLNVASSLSQRTRVGTWISFLLLLMSLAAYCCYSKVRRDSNDAEGTSTYTYSAPGDQRVQVPQPEEEVQCGSDEVNNLNSETHPVSVDESAMNGDNSNGYDIQHCGDQQM